jgi:hypothetical protein
VGWFGSKFQQPNSILVGKENAPPVRKELEGLQTGTGLKLARDGRVGNILNGAGFKRRAVEDKVVSCRDTRSG